MKPHLLQFITRNLRGRPCTVAQIALTKQRLRATFRALAMLAGALFLAAEIIVIIQLAFAL